MAGEDALAEGDSTMTYSKYLLAAAVAAVALPAAAHARSMRAVGSSTVYPFAKMVAERVARAIREMVVLRMRVGSRADGLEIGLRERWLVGRERSRRSDLSGAARGEKCAARDSERGEGEKVETRGSQRDRASY